MADVPPSQTIYVNNLNEKVKIEPLKKAMYAMFSQFGTIIDVVASKSLKRRGQAWVVFEDTASATNALRQMQGFPFYDKPMRIAFSKNKSDAVAKKDGTYVPREKRKRDDEKDAEESEKRTAVEPMEDVGEAGGAGGVAAAAPGAPVAAQMEEAAPPNKVLLAQELPEKCTADMLKFLFKQYAGLVEVRPVQGRGMAFIDFEDEMQASIALQGLNGFKLDPTTALKLAYAKR